MRAYYFTIIYIYIYIYNSNFLLTHKIVFCHIVILSQLSHKRLYAPGGDTLLLLAETPQSASGKIRFASCKR